jgi:CO/xanthine dehydrogenase Mo-binding subunit
MMECLIDMAARRLSIDPAELRLRNLIRMEKFPIGLALSARLLPELSA